MSAIATQFAQNIGPSAVQACVNTGLYPSVLIAQGIHESDSGKSAIARMLNNIFGHAGDAGNGKQVKPGGRFWRWYSNIIDCIKDHIEILKRPRYRLTGTFKSKTPFSQALAIQKAGYDTGPDREQYAAKLIAIIKAYNLQVYDTQMFALERKANPNNLAYNEQSATTQIIQNLIG